MPPARRHVPPSLACALALCLLGLAAPGAHALTGGAQADAPGEHGGTAFGTPAPARPVAALFSVSPGRITEGRRPKVRLRIEQPDTATVAASVRVVDRRTRRLAAKIKLGSVRVGRTVSVRWPRRAKLKPGRYVVRLHARDGRGGALARAAQATGRAKLEVRAKPKPKPKPKPAPKPAPAPSPAPAPGPAPESGGVFPVRGSWSFGGEGSRYGASRTTHTHQGQDVAAAEGTPLVSPLPGTVAFVDFQKGGAGWYVVINADDGRSLFFAHLQSGSVVVRPGQRVVAGGRIGAVGSTGSSSGPHLHFEIWQGGWRDRGGRPIDPLPQLRAWAR